MKRIIYSITLTLIAVMFSSNVARAQDNTGTKVTDEKLKQKEAEAVKKKAEMEAQKKAQEEMFLNQAKEQQKAQEELETELKSFTIIRDERDLERIRERAEEMSRDIHVSVPYEDRVYKYMSPEMGEYYIQTDMTHRSKPASSWNYSRQVLEATFSNEFTMDSGGELNNINVSVSGDCAEGSIAIAVIMPDGKQLSEVVIDANGSLNWRKSFQVDESDGWKNGNWIFRINAKNATGNFRISMSAL